MVNIYEHFFGQGFLLFYSKGYRLTWSTLEAVCREITNNLKDATELLHNIMSINQPFSTHSTSSTTDFDDQINSHVRRRKKPNDSSLINPFEICLFFSSRIPLLRTVNHPVQLSTC